MSDVIDIRPRLRARRAKTCKHACVTVDFEIASLTCDDCEAEIDPWWWIRKVAKDDIDLRESADRAVAAKYAEMEEAVRKHNAWVATANETIDRKNAEIRALYDTKNRLANEVINGVRVGSVTRRTRSRKTTV